MWCLSRPFSLRLSPLLHQMQQAPVLSVSVPGADGQMTITNLHASLISRLKVGEILVREKEGAEPRRFFVSDGFIFVNTPKDDSNCGAAEVVGVEVVPSEYLDKEAAAQQLQQLLQTAATANDPWSRAKSFLGQELLGSVMRAAQ